MPPFRPLKRKELIRYLKKIGFDGPYSGSKHRRVGKFLGLPNHTFNINYFAHPTLILLRTRPLANQKQ